VALRRRFLRDSLRGSVPLLLGLGSDALRDRPGADPPAAGRTCPPFPAPDAPPASIKESIDRHHQGFARDNPGMTRYPGG
jgi:hypothetical protein